MSNAILLVVFQAKMLHRSGDLDEEQLAEVARRDIPYYSKVGDEVCFVPYMDDGKKKFIQYVLANGQWIYIESSQFS